MNHPVDQLARCLFGSDAEAIPFQRRVYDAIVAGRSVVLQAPTGAGKTFAALAPLALGAWGREGGKPATKLIYSLPLRVLAGSLRDQYRELFRKATEARHGADLWFTTQYGGAAEDEFLDLKRGEGIAERGVVFATIDQTLSGFLGVPLSLPNRLANVLYGSVLSGALVFDEVHLLEADKSFTTALHLLKQSPWPVLVMTATMSTTLRRDLCCTLDAEEIVVDEREDLPRIRSQRDTIKRVEVCKTPMDGRTIATSLGRRTLVLCNTVDRAQAVYSDLCKELERDPDAPEMMLLHSRFLPEDREAKESMLRTCFGKESTGRYVLVSTQVVEAGLDISCDVMHTEASPADSFLQRIGRSARFEGEYKAEVYVYPPDSEGSNKPYLPYRKAPVEATLQVLRDRPTIRYDDIQDLIDRIHEDEQSAYVANHESGEANLAERIHQVRRDVERSANQELVRLVDNVEIVVATEAELMSRDISPYAYPAVSLRRDTFRYRYIEQGVVRALRVEEITDEAGTGRGNRYFLLEPVESGQKLKPGRYVVSPNDAAYDKDLGLRLGEPGDTSFPPPTEVPMWTRHDYEEESYEDHIRRVFKRDEVRPAALEAIRRLSVRGILPEPVQNPERLIDLVIWTHDIAKLTDGWQAAHGDRDLCGGDPLAHGGRESKPPPHAAESAWAVYRLLYNVLVNEGKEAATTWASAIRAIRTHHGPKTWDVGAYRIRQERREYLELITPRLRPVLAQCLANSWDEIAWSASGGEQQHWRDQDMLNGAHDPLYALLVYMLRRSDQLATSEVSVAKETPATPVRPAPNSY